MMPFNLKHFFRNSSSLHSCAIGALVYEVRKGRNVLSIMPGLGWMMEVAEPRGLPAQPPAIVPRSFQKTSPSSLLQRDEQY